MLIQRRSSSSTISTRGSAGPWGSTTPRARVARRKRGLGRLGIGSEWVVQHRNQGLFKDQSAQGTCGKCPLKVHDLTCLPGQMSEAASVRDVGEPPPGWQSNERGSP